MGKEKVRQLLTGLSLAGLVASVGITAQAAPSASG